MSLDRFDILAHVVEITNASVDVNERLDAILGTINSHLGSRQSVLFLQEQAQRQLTMANSWPRLPMEQEPLTSEFGQGQIGKVARDREPLLFTLEGACGDAAIDSLCRPRELAALFPVMDDNRLYGVLLMLFAPGRSVEPNEVRLMQTVAREMAGTIRNHRLYFEAKRRITELNVISDLGRAAVSTIELDELLETVASMVAKLLGAKGGLVCINAPHPGTGRLLAHFGQVPQSCVESEQCRQDCEKSGAGPAESNGFSTSVGSTTGMCVPLSFKGNYSGHLCVFEKMVSIKGASPAFNVEDRNLLATMSSMISSALENALVFQRVEELAQRNEEMVGSLATLYEISTVLMTTMDFDKTVRIILTAAIHPAGFDHEKVVLFLIDEDDKVLVPVADMSRSGHEGQWAELMQSLMSIRDQREHQPIMQDERLSDLTIALQPEDSILAATVAQGRTFRINDPVDNPRFDNRLVDILGPDPFVSVPVFAKGKVIGVLLVNNFLSKRPLLERDLRLLGMLANLGGLSLETARLYHHLERVNKELAQMRNRLLEADKLAALGEIAAGVAHEIRNPLVSIGGFTRRIRKKVGDDSPITQYLDVIIDEVTRLERTLNEMLDFSSDARGHFEEHNLNDIIEQSLELLDRELGDHEVQVNRVYGENLPQVFCDDRQIKHVFLNLFLNAIQAMGEAGGTLTVRTFTVMREAKQFVAGEVSDTGGGIPMDVVHNIFNPFFTTKDQGSGLGLSIVHKIVTRHYGQVEVHNLSGEGAAFLVTLPAAEEGRAYLK